MCPTVTGNVLFPHSVLLAPAPCRLEVAGAMLNCNTSGARVLPVTVPLVDYWIKENEKPFLFTALVPLTDKGLLPASESRDFYMKSSGLCSPYHCILFILQNCKWGKESSLNFERFLQQ